MDSKYSSMGLKEKGVKFNLKKKAPHVKHKQKKYKMKNGSANTSLTNVLNNLQENGCQNKGIISQENVHEARKKLPVYMERFSLLEEVKKSKTMIVIGETGSGKTTQIPQILYNAGLHKDGAIAITQPRRVAAITIALRVASEMRTDVGNLVGYTVRFEDASSQDTKIKYLTDGMLLREAIADSLLTKYSIIILDEAHERTVNTDVLFGIVKLAQKERNNLSQQPLMVIIMSATMDVDAFSRYFDNCPVIYLEGRTYPVTVYHSMVKHDDYQYAAICTIFQLHATAPPNHDFLVFLTGQEEIESLMYNIKQMAKEAQGPQIKVCPLYAGLPPLKQLQVWKNTPIGMRKIVLATNIAEASITIPNIKYVIDTGMVKERTWCGTTGAEKLRVCKCARAACWQRAGRAGRDSAGHAYRLYTSRDFTARPAHNQPEIMRCPLAPTILLLIAVGVEPSTFPLMDMPPQDSINASLTLLRDLGAIANEANLQLTPLGKQMSLFPIDPKYSKIILSAHEYNCLDEILSIIAVLSSESVFHTPMNKRELALTAKQKFISSTGDHITLLNVFKGFWKSPSKNEYCKENFLNHRNLTYAFEVRQQLLSICQRFNMTVNSCGQAMDQVLKCMLNGLSTNCAWLRGGDGTGGPARYVTSSGAVASLHPASSLHSIRPLPPAVLYSDLLHTRRTYLLTVSALQSHWLTHMERTAR